MPRKRVCLRAIESAVTPDSAPEAAPSSRARTLAVAAGIALVAFIVGSFLYRYAWDYGPAHALDVVLYFYPAYAATYGRVAALHLPLWNPFQLCGIPWIAPLQVGFYYPLHLLYVLLPLNWAFEIASAANLVCAGVAMALFARRMGLCGSAALAGAVVFALRGWVPAGLSEPNALEAIVWLPVGALAIAELARGGGARATALLAVAVGLSFLAGYPQPTTYSLYALASFLPAMLVGERAGARRWLVASLLALGGVALGAALAAAQLVPTAELLTYGGARGTSTLPPQAMMRFIQGVRIWGQQVISGDAVSVGIVAWGLFAAAPFATPRRKRALGLWAIGLTLVTGAWSFGPATPLFRVYLALPALSWFRNPQRILVVTDFGIATAVAVGLDAVVSAVRGGAGAAARGRIAAAPLAAIVGVATTMVLALRGFAPKETLPSLWLFAAATALIAVLALARLRALPAGLLGAALLALIATEVSLLPPFPYRLPFEDKDLEAYHSNHEMLEYLRELGGSQRVWIYGAGLSAEVGPKAMTRFGVRSINDYEPVSLRRQAEYFRYLTEGSTRITREPWVFLGDIGTLSSPPGVAPAATRRRLLDLAALRYFVLLPAAPVSRPASDGAFPVDAKMTKVGQTKTKVELWNNPYALPRAYVTYHWQAAPPADDLLAAISQESYDPLASTYVEGDPPPPAPGAPARGGPAEVTVDTERIVEVDATLEAPGMLVLADTAFPGWKATVDGSPVPIYTANYLFRAIPVPAGRHHIRFEYLPRSVPGGLAVSGLAAAACVGLLWAGARRRRAVSP